MLAKLFSLDLVRNLPWPDRRELSFLRARATNGPLTIQCRVAGVDELDRSLGRAADDALLAFLEAAEQHVRVADDFTRTGRDSFRLTLVRATPAIAEQVRRRLEAVHAASTIASTTHFVVDDQDDTPLRSAG
jgi:hypothetical protein